MTNGIVDIKLENVPGAEDKDKAILIDGREVGTVSRGWLRLGGEQWVITAPQIGLSSTGERTLKDIKRKIAYKLSIL